MKILIHSTTLDGEPLEADGIALEGKTCTDLVKIMKGQTPFTIEAVSYTHLDVYKRQVSPFFSFGLSA